MTQNCIRHIANHVLPFTQDYIIKKSTILEYGKMLGYEVKDFVVMFDKQFNVKFGYYTIEPWVKPTKSELQKVEPIPEQALMLSTPIQDIEVPANNSTFVPKKSATFVKWGEYYTLEKIIASKAFFPVFIAGLSGNGKSLCVEQVCANLGREMIRVQIDPGTDDTSLIGGYTLVNGETVFQKGPIINAMLHGRVILIDECDRGSHKATMCIQGIAEGGSYFLKQTGEVITPKPGFNIIATANTLGRGSDDGRYTAAQILDDAFLERFTITINQEYPSQAIEKKIILAHMEKYGKTDLDFATKLVTWSSVIRKTFEDNGIDELISTRRLCHIVQTFALFENRLDCIKMCISRFDKDTRNAFLDLYTKVDSDATKVDSIATKV